MYNKEHLAKQNVEVSHGVSHVPLKVTMDVVGHWGYPFKRATFKSFAAIVCV